MLTPGCLPHSLAPCPHPQTDILQLLYYRCRSSPNLAATCLTHTEVSRAGAQLVGWAPCNSAYSTCTFVVGCRRHG
jgi:hypothetical protein